jgi:hypothetical protein
VPHRARNLQVMGSFESYGEDKGVQGGR